MNCETIRGYLAVRQELSYTEEQAVQQHVRSCRACQDYGAMLGQTRQDIQQLTAWHGELAGSTRARIMQRLTLAGAHASRTSRQLQLAGLALLLVLMLLLGKSVTGWRSTPLSGQPGLLPGRASPPAPAQTVTLPPNMTTILVLGSDARPGQSGSFDTDSAALVLLDPEHQVIQVMLIPGYVLVSDGKQSMPLRSLYAAGEAAQGPGGGRMAIKRGIQHFVSLEVQYVVLLRFESFVQLVDQLGGLPVTVPEIIDDRHYPDDTNGTQPVHFDAGAQLLDGQRALIYARTRQGGTELARLARQQQLIQAFIGQIDAQQLLTQPAKLQTLADILQASIETDLPVATVLAWAPWAATMDLQHIRVAAIDPLPPEGAPTPAPTLETGLRSTQTPAPAPVVVERLSTQYPWIWQPGQTCGRDGGVLISPQSPGGWAQLRPPVLALAERPAQSPVLLICTDQDALALLDTQTWTTVSVPLEGVVLMDSMVAQPTGSAVAFTSTLADGTRIVMVADIQTGRVTPLEATRTKGDPFTALAWQGTQLILQQQTSATTLLWQIDTAADQPVLQPLRTISETGVLAVAPDGRILAWSYAGKALMIQVLPDGAAQELRSATNADTQVLFAPDSQTLALLERLPTNNSFILRLYDLTQTPIHQRGNDIPIEPLRSVHGAPIWRWSADSQQLWIATEEMLLSVDRTGALVGQHPRPLPEGTQIQDIRIADDGTVVCIVATDAAPPTLMRVEVDRTLETIPALPPISNGPYRIVYSP